MDRWKGIEILLAAAPLLAEKVPGVRIVIAGGTRARSYYEGLASGMRGVEIRARRQDDAEVRALFEEAEVLVLPYVEASQSGVLQVGVAFGVPAVVTDVGGLPEAVGYGEAGVVVRAGDAAGLASAIASVLLEVPLREKLVKAIVERRQGEGSWAVHGTRTLDMYRGVS